MSQIDKPHFLKNLRLKCHNQNILYIKIFQNNTTKEQKNIWPLNNNLNGGTASCCNNPAQMQQRVMNDDCNTFSPLFPELK